MSILSERLATIRKERNFTQATVVNLLNNKISVAQLSNYETGKREPDFLTLSYLSKLYHVSSDYLLGLSDEEVPQVREIADATGLSNYVISILCNIDTFSVFLNAIFNSDEIKDIYHECYLIQNMIERINNEKKFLSNDRVLYQPDNTESVRIHSEDFFAFHSYKLGSHIAKAIEKWSIKEYGGDINLDSSTEISL